MICKESAKSTQKGSTGCFGVTVTFEEEEEEEEKEKEKEEDAPEEEMHVIPRLIDVDADGDYLQYLEELQRHPQYSPIHSSQTFSQYPSDGYPSQSSNAHSQPSFDLSGVWPLPVAANPSHPRKTSRRRIPNLVVKLYCGDDTVGEVLQKNILGCGIPSESKTKSNLKFEGLSLWEVLWFFLTLIPIGNTHVGLGIPPIILAGNR
ncbi:hypothetical protein PIB30_033643 [Stylosanthes scabra]|uniref:Uncharacterized protein n=1 Tax=Stylosanthes scabra TaxID=79078 RepID=A0ABU6SE03_9FABA|nr:hypothetical protein [Stylosanthes scabra]